MVFKLHKSDSLLIALLSFSMFVNVIDHSTCTIQFQLVPEVYTKVEIPFNIILPLGTAHMKRTLDFAKESALSCVLVTVSNHLFALVIIRTTFRFTEYLCQFLCLCERASLIQ